MRDLYISYGESKWVFLYQLHYLEEKSHKRGDDIDVLNHFGLLFICYQYHCSMPPLIYTKQFLSTTFVTYCTILFLYTSSSILTLKSCNR